MTHSSPIGTLKEKITGCVLQCIRPEDMHLACFILNTRARGVSEKILEVILKGRSGKIDRIDFVPTLGVLKDEHSALPNITDIILAHEALYSTYDEPVDKYTLLENILLSSLLKPSNLLSLLLHNISPVEPVLKLSYTNFTVIEVANHQERTKILAEIKQLSLANNVETFKYLEFANG